MGRKKIENNCGWGGASCSIGAGSLCVQSKRYSDTVSDANEFPSGDNAYAYVDSRAISDSHLHGDSSGYPNIISDPDSGRKPLPVLKEAIEPQNVDRLKSLARLGKGSISSAV